MTTYYADGRPAQVGGQQVRYDAGGRPHAVANPPAHRAVRLLASGGLDLRALEEIEALSKQEPTSDAHAAEILQSIYDKAHDRLEANR
jgi:hypothetical protein